MSACRYFSNSATVMVMGSAPCSFHAFFTSGRLTIFVIFGVQPVRSPPAAFRPAP